MTTPVHLTVGSVFGGDFRVVRRLSEGGMGAVWIAEQLSTGKERALKVMHAELVIDAKLRERFVQEAKVGAKIESDHIVEVVAAGVDAQTGMPWLAMELLKGEPLAERWARGPIDRATLGEVFGQLGHALGAAHDAGIVHRDLKPDNIFLATPRRSGVPFMLKVLDFGIAKLVLESHTKQTQSIGTPMWMAPEQSEIGKAIRPATDVWALGLIAYALLTGRSYWHAVNTEGAGALQLMREIVMDPLDPASMRAETYGVRHLVPAGFDEWFARSVARSVEARYPDARVAIDALVPLLGAAAARPVVATVIAPPTATMAMPPPRPQPASTTAPHHLTVPMSGSPVSPVNPGPERAGSLGVASAGEKPRGTHRTTYAIVGGLAVLGLVGAVWAMQGPPTPPSKNTSAATPDPNASPTNTATTTAITAAAPTFAPAAVTTAAAAVTDLPAPPDVAAPPASALKEKDGLASLVLTTGKGKVHPNPTSTVKVHYTGWTTDGKMFDSSVARGVPVSLPLDGVIPGWTEGVQLMVEGEKRRLWIPQELAYKGQPGSPAGMLVYDVELLKIESLGIGAAVTPVSTTKAQAVPALTTATATAAANATAPTLGNCPTYKGDYVTASKGADYECVRTILLPRLNAGSISSGEARFLKAACTQLGDISCAKRAADKMDGPPPKSPPPPAAGGNEPYN